VAGNQNDRRDDAAIPQLARQIDAIHIRHFVVYHKAVGSIRGARVQERGTTPERPDLEAVGFQQEPQRTEHPGSSSTTYTVDLADDEDITKRDPWLMTSILSAISAGAA